MRQGFNNSFLFVPNTNDFIGVNLGADNCAEHECGTDGIDYQFAINRQKFGIDGKLINKSTSNLIWIENIKINPKNKKDKTVWSGFYCGWDTLEPYINNLRHNNTAIVSAWSEQYFCCFAKDVKDIAYLKQIFDAFIQNNIVIWRGGGGVFQNAGLCIAIATNIPDDIANNWYNSDFAHHKMMNDFKNTGIEERLKNAGKDWFSLKPSIFIDGTTNYWLNPKDQKRYNFGWFSMEELEMWAKNSVPIIKEKK